MLNDGKEKLLANYGPNQWTSEIKHGPDSHRKLCKLLCTHLHSYVLISPGASEVDPLML